MEVTSLLPSGASINLIDLNIIKPLHHLPPMTALRKRAGGLTCRPQRVVRSGTRLAGSAESLRSLGRTVGGPSWLALES